MEGQKGRQAGTQADLFVFCDQLKCLDALIGERRERERERERRDRTGWKRIRSFTRRKGCESSPLWPMTAVLHTPIADIKPWHFLPIT